MHIEQDRLSGKDREGARLYCSAGLLHILRGKENGALLCRQHMVHRSVGEEGEKEEGEGHVKNGTDAINCNSPLDKTIIRSESNVCQLSPTLPPLYPSPAAPLSARHCTLRTTNYYRKINASLPHN